jgi:protein O-GlcNAc transferase
MEAFNKAVSLQQSNPKKALKLCEEVLSKNPLFLPALQLGTSISVKEKDFSKGITFAEKICSIEETPKNLNQLASFFVKSDNSLQAIKALKKSLFLDPYNPETLVNLAILHVKQQNYEQAVEILEKYLKKNPANKTTMWALGFSYYHLNEFKKSSLVLRKAHLESPENLSILKILSSNYYNQNLFYQTSQIIEKLIKLEPTSEAYNDLGIAYLNQRLYTKAFQATEKALAIDPFNRMANTNRLFLINYVDEGSPADIYRLHRQWGEKTEKRYPPSFCFKNHDKNPNKTLRIGYVSADFKQHSVAHFISGILQGHAYNESNIEIFCYYTGLQSDCVTEQIKSIGHHWVPLPQEIPNEEAAKIVYKDKIDILIDLNGHTAENRLNMFALKPAPIQISYLGYPNTTGLSTIDYRFTDAIADPQQNQAFYSEKLLYLPNIFLCYNPAKESPVLTPPPCIDRGFITFGSFNTLRKISTKVLSVWCEILNKIPNSELFLKNGSLGCPHTKSIILRTFTEAGIAKERIHLHSFQRLTQDHLAFYNKIDISLDTFPYNGTTTTCEATWMGVPTITLCREEHRNRVGKTILNQVGLEDFVANNSQEYIEKAIKYSKSISELSILKNSLRPIIENSYLCTPLAFTQNLEGLYQSLWKKWTENN